MQSKTRSETCQRVIQPSPEGYGGRSDERSAGRREYWLEMLDLQKQSDMTVTDFCKEMGIHPTSFYTWRKKLQAKPQSVEVMDDFMEITVCKEREVRPASAGLTVLVGGMQVEISQKFCADTLKRVIAILRDVS